MHENFSINSRTALRTLPEYTLKQSDMALRTAPYMYCGFLIWLHGHSIREMIGPKSASYIEHGMVHQPCVLKAVTKLQCACDRNNFFLTVFCEQPTEVSWKLRCFSCFFHAHVNCVWMAEWTGYIWVRYFLKILCWAVEVMSLFNRFRCSFPFNEW